MQSSILKAIQAMADAELGGISNSEVRRYFTRLMELSGDVIINAAALIHDKLSEGHRMYDNNFAIATIHHAPSDNLGRRPYRHLEIHHHNQAYLISMKMSREFVGIPTRAPSVGALIDEILYCDDDDNSEWRVGTDVEKISVYALGEASSHGLVERRDKLIMSPMSVSDVTLLSVMRSHITDKGQWLPATPDIRGANGLVRFTYALKQVGQLMDMGQYMAAWAADIDRKLAREEASPRSGGEELAMETARREGFLPGIFASQVDRYIISENIRQSLHVIKERMERVVEILLNEETPFGARDPEGYLLVNDDDHDRVIMSRDENGGQAIALKADEVSASGVFDGDLFTLHLRRAGMTEAEEITVSLEGVKIKENIKHLPLNSLDSFYLMNAVNTSITGVLGALEGQVSLRQTSRLAL